MDYRIEHDTMGEVRVPANRCWGAQTQRSHENFPIGTEKIPQEIIHAFAVLKKAAALANCKLGNLDARRANAIAAACDEILAGKLDDEFPLVVWQTGSGTQSNMNVNEVVAARANALLGEKLVHPNDHVNKSQSSNDTFPTAMHIAALTAAEDHVLPALDGLAATFERLSAEYADVIKVGRTHLQDATPLTLGQEISGWSSSLRRDERMIRGAMEGVRELALGGTAVGTGLNALPAFGETVAQEISALTGKRFVTAPNKFHALTSKDELVYLHGAFKALAADLMKIANDVRLLASGPRCGIGELLIPENEPGSSIMPGKINPTVPEMVIQIGHQVCGNDVAITMAIDEGELDLNVWDATFYKCLFENLQLVGEEIVILRRDCVEGITANESRCKEEAESSIALSTVVAATFGYPQGVEVAHYCEKHRCNVKDAVVAMGLMTQEQAEILVDPSLMANPEKMAPIVARFKKELGILI